MIQEGFLLICFGRAIYEITEIFFKKREEEREASGGPRGAQIVDYVLEKCTACIFPAVLGHFYLS